MIKHATYKILTKPSVARNLLYDLHGRFLASIILFLNKISQTCNFFKYSLIIPQILGPKKVKVLATAFILFFSKTVFLRKF